jgi:hypothetical protein
MRHRVTVVGLAMLLTVGAPSTEHATAQQPEPTISLTPSIASPGTFITIDGTGFQPDQQFVILFGSLHSEPLGTGSTDSLGQVKTRFPVPQVSPGDHEVFVCTNHNPSAPYPCRQDAPATLTVVATTTTTTTTTTAPPLVTETTQPTTTTSSLSLSATTTSTTVRPGLEGDFGTAFTTTSTSLQIPPGFQSPGDAPFYPDLEIRDVEVVQVIQDLGNRMPLIADKTTMVRVYVGIDQPEPGNLGALVGDTPPTTVGPEGWTPVDGVIHLQRGGETTIIYADNGPITAYVDGGDRTRRNDTLNFHLPSGWTQGQVTITAFIWSDHPNTALYAEADSGNNFAQGTVVFHESNPPLVVIWRLDPGTINTLTPTGFLHALDKFTESYQKRLPLAVPNFHPIMEALGPGSIVGDDEPSETWDMFNNPSEPLLRMRWMYLLFGYTGMERMHGAIHLNTSTDKVSGITHSSMTVAWSKPTENTPAHEQAHMYGIKHVPCRDDDEDGVPDEVDGGGWGWIDLTHPTGFPNCSLAPVDPRGFYGAHIAGSFSTFYPNDPEEQFTRYPFMSYMANKFADPYHYCLLMPVYGIPCNPAALGLPPKASVPAPLQCGFTPGSGYQLDLCLWAGTDDPLWPSGVPGGLALVAPDGDFEDWALVEIDTATGMFGHAHRTSHTRIYETDFAHLIERAKQGMLADHTMARITDANGHILLQVPVAARPPAIDAHHDFGDGTTLVALPWPDGAHSLDLLTDGDVSDSLQASAPPVVAIDPVDPEPGRQFALTWTAEDPEGADLLYTVQWSVDGDGTWRVLDTGFPQAYAHIDADALQLPGGQVHLKVTASDGFDTGSDEVGPLTIPTGLPSGFIVGPETVLQYEVAELTFHIYDPEDGLLSSGNWESDIDGPLGDGRTVSTRHLSIGSHEISVTVDDSDGNTVTIIRALEVEESDLPAPRPLGSVPEAETIVALGPANLDQYRIEGLEEFEAVDESTAPPTDSGLPGWAVWAVVGLAAVTTGGLLWRRRRG